MQAEGAETERISLDLPAGWLASEACPEDVRRLVRVNEHDSHFGPADAAAILTLGCRLLDPWRSASAFQNRREHARHVRLEEQMGQDLTLQRARCEELVQQLRAAEAAAEAQRRVREALQTEIGAAVAQARQEAHAHAQALAASVQTLVEAARADERSRAGAEIDRARQELQDCRGQMQAAWGRQVRGGAAVRGRDNEAHFRDLLVRSYGDLPGFAVLETANVPESGDHIVTLDHAPHAAEPAPAPGARLSLMFENKKYAHAVPRAEVEKAHRDFRLHPECAALFFVSGDSRITGQERAHDLDMAVVDGRPVFYVSHFGRCEDPVALLHMLLAVVRMWCARHTHAQSRLGRGISSAPNLEGETRAPACTETETDTETEAETRAMAAVRGEFVRSFERVRLLRTLWNSAKRRLDTVWREFAAEIEAAVAHFESTLNGRSPEDGNGDGDGDGGDNVGGSIVSATPGNYKRPRVSKRGRK